MEKPGEGLPTADVALYKLYSAQPKGHSPSALKPHPYQSFDMSAIFSAANKSNQPEKSTQEQASEPVTTLTLQSVVCKLEKAHIPEMAAESSRDIKTKESTEMLGLINKLKISEGSSVQQPFVEQSVNSMAKKQVNTKQLPKDEQEKSSAEADRASSQHSLKTNSTKEVQPGDKSAFKLTAYKSESIVETRLKKTRNPCLKCTSCQVYLGFDEQEVLSHIQSEPHKKEKLLAGRTVTLRLLSLTKKTGAHTARLDSLINQTCGAIGITTDMVQLSKTLLKKYGTILSALDEGKCLSLTGSMEYGIGVESSDVNFLLSVEEKRSPFQKIHQVKAVLAPLAEVSELKLEPTGLLRFVDTPTSTKITISLSNKSSAGTTMVLKEYVEYMEKNAIEAWKVVCCFRHWANICGLDRKDDGMMHGYMFVIMAIDILQKLGAIPVLAQMRSREQIDKWKPRKPFSAGELWWALWMELIHFRAQGSAFSINQHASPLREEKGWGVKRLAMESPGDPKINLCRDIPCVAAFDRFIAALRASAYYFCIPQLRTGPLFHVLRTSVRPQPKQRLGHPSEDEENGKTPKKKDSEGLEKENKPSVDKKKGRKASEKSRNSNSESEAFRVGRESITSHEGLVPFEGEEDMVEIEFLEHTDTVMKSKKGDTVRVETDRYDKIVVKGEVESSDSDDDSDGSDTEEESFDNIDVDVAGVIRMSVECAVKETEKLDVEDLEYRFDENILTDGMKPLKLCMICKTSGHNALSCPDVALPPVKPLPAITGAHFNNLEITLYSESNRLKPSPYDLSRKRRAIDEIQAIVRQRFPYASIVPFGSCNNGFGFSGSDVDLCLIFNENPTGEGVDGVKIVHQLSGHLKRNRAFRMVTAISSAKVPIVKGFYAPYNVEVDISVYNTLGIHNTRLLYTYATMDPRVQDLGYLAKHMAKTCDIGDASKGTLSSYAYIMLVLYYAQRCNPPLIPNLQELYNGDTALTPERIIDGWNTWFFEPSIHMPLAVVWPGFQRNKEPLSVHWINFLSFYGEEFDWSNYVVSIRQIAPLPKLDKSWADKEICIEDPFNLMHNLGAGLTLKMATHIKSVLIECREHFGFPVDELPKGCRNWQDYFWHPHYLIKSQPPNDRPGCFVCGSVRHRKVDCPRNMPNKRRAGNKPFPKNENSRETRPAPRAATDVPVRVDTQEYERKRPERIDGVEKYQAKTKSRFSESDGVSENSANDLSWRKYVPNLCRGGKSESQAIPASKPRSAGKQTEDWPELPAPSSPARGSVPLSEPLKESGNRSRMNVTKKLDLGSDSTVPVKEKKKRWSKPKLFEKKKKSTSNQD